MRAALAAAVAVLAALAVSAAAGGQPPSGVARPPDEAALSDPQLGAELYAGNCSSCHGIDGRGVYGPAQRGAGNVKGLGPTLKGVGAQAADFYLRTGYMPLRNVHEQPYRRRVLFSEREIRALVAYVASLSPGPSIPQTNPASGNVATGLHAFTEHCAGCHQVVAEGGYVTDVRVPPIKQDSPVQIAEAVRIGPYLMPTFSKTAISDAELNSIVAYLQQAKKPDDRGGWGIGHVGPVPEGIVAWFVAACVLVFTCVLIGRRAKA